MRRAPDTLALAPRDTALLERAAKLAAIGRVEVRVGIGPVEDPPARVLGHARCLVQLLTEDLPQLLRVPDRVHLFSTAPKIAHLAGRHTTSMHLRALAALAGALRIDGYQGEIVVEEACESREIPLSVANLVSLRPSSLEFLAKAAANNPNGAGHVEYAIEHAAASMYADIDPDSEPDQVRVTVGAKPEGRFWAVRREVVVAAEQCGLRTCTSMALILRTLARAWYAPTSEEPALADMCFVEPEVIASRLDRAANPTLMGNPALKREARNTTALVKAKPDRARALAFQTATVSASAEFLIKQQFTIGPRLAHRIKKVR